MRMAGVWALAAVVILDSVGCFPDLTPEAITVYRNPEFFKNLNYGSKYNYNQKSTKAPQENPEDYKYPGETKKPNPTPPSPGFEVTYDNSPEFNHEPRDIFVDTNYKPSRRKGPYGPRYSSENNLEEAPTGKAYREEESEEEESREDSKEDSKENSKENEGFVEGSESDEGKDFSSVLSPLPDEEFRTYHEPILHARPGFDPDTSPGFASSTYSQPYAYNRTTPVLYEDWKYYTYPKIHANQHLKSESSLIYSEEPASNAFESPAYDDEAEYVGNLFENNDYKDSGSDTKHIYKKLLNPKKSIFFKFHSKPKIKKLQLKLRKKHHRDWFNEYPFNF